MISTGQASYQRYKACVDDRSKAYARASSWWGLVGVMLLPMTTAQHRGGLISFHLIYRVVNPR